MVGLGDAHKHSARTAAWVTRITTRRKFAATICVSSIVFFSSTGRKHAVELIVTFVPPLLTLALLRYPRHNRLYRPHVCVCRYFVRPAGVVDGITPDSDEAHVVYKQSDVIHDDYPKLTG